MDKAYDCVIKGGKVFDGSLAEPSVTDVGIRGDKIAEIGPLTGQAARTIDATGLIVTPGFIDVHTHCDATFKRSGSMAERAASNPS